MQAVQLQPALGARPSRPSAVQAAARLGLAPRPAGLGALQRSSTCRQVGLQADPEGLGVSRVRMVAFPAPLAAHSARLGFPL